MELFKWLSKNIFHFIGSLMLGVSIPVGAFVFTPLIDFIIFFPLGILFLSISYYYTFKNIK